MSKTPARDLPGIFAEIVVCGWLTTIGTVKVLSPRTGRCRPGSTRETRSEAVVEIDGIDVFVEVKRLEDNFESRNDSKRPGRSLLTHDPVPARTRHPFTMDLRSKLEDAPDQLPSDRPSILLVFVDARLATDVPSLQFAVFGECHKPASVQHSELHQDGLFLDDRWRSVSACCSAESYRGEIVTRQILYNPLANVTLPVGVRARLEATAARLAIAAAR